MTENVIFGRCAVGGLSFTSWRRQRIPGPQSLNEKDDPHHLKASVQRVKMPIDDAWR